jgi:5-hydroxyisourate hydrolase
MSVSTHVLDASLGIPAAGVPVTLSTWTGAGSVPFESAGSTWTPVAAGVTDADGRHRFTAPTPAGAYRLTFGTAAYFAARAVTAFYPEVTVTFTIPDAANAARSGDAGTAEPHCHVPLLLSPFAYSTYRGS